MTYLISELSNQWGGDIQQLKSFILQSAFCGANAVKIQLFGNDWNIKRLNSSGNDYLSISKDEYQILSNFSKTHGIELFASPFDNQRLNWCIENGDNIIKIGYGVFRDRREIANKAVESGKKVIVSIDPSKEDIIEPPYGSSKNVSYLLTSRKYPTLLNEIELPFKFSDTIFQGYSDHCPGISACLVAITRGAEIIEKHFTQSTAWQKVGEMGHTGGMEASDLKLLRKLERELRLVINSNLKCF